MQRILVIAVPGIGDAFLATPLIRALKSRYPEAAVDVLVRDGSSILEGSPDIARVLVQPRRPSVRRSIRFLASVFRRYDLAVSTSTTDRAFIILAAAARLRAGKLASVDRGTWWKRRLVQHYVLVDPEAHVLSENGRLAGFLGLERQWSPRVPNQPHGPGPEGLNLPFDPETRPFAVVHMKPGSAVRQWPDHYWRELIDTLRKRALPVVASGGGSASERAYIDRILSGVPSGAESVPLCSIAGRLPFAGLAELVRRAALFIGTDTSVTHVAAATGVPTIALFGPTDPVRWGPWPAGLERDGSPWKRDRIRQHTGNVTLLRVPCDCGPRRPACGLAPEMPGACMSTLLPETVIASVDQILDRRETPRRLTGW